MCAIILLTYWMMMMELIWGKRTRNRWHYGAVTSRCLSLLCAPDPLYGHGRPRALAFFSGFEKVDSVFIRTHTQIPRIIESRRNFDIKRRRRLQLLLYLFWSNLLPEIKNGSINNYRLKRTRLHISTEVVSFPFPHGCNPVLPSRCWETKVKVLAPPHE